MNKNNVLYIVIFLGLVICAFFYGSSKTIKNPKSPKPHHSRSQKWEIPTARREPSNDLNEPWIERIGWQPRVEVYHNLLTNEECDEIIAIGEPHLERSRVVAENDDTSIIEARSSYGMFLTNQFMMKHAILRDIERRCALWTMIPEENSESFNLLRYELGQEYKPHSDYFDPKDAVASRYIGVGGNRYATVLIYLQDADEGGGTVFPNANIKVFPDKGDAILFWNLTPFNEVDEYSIHGGLPVIKGTKWVMTKWIHEGKMDYYRNNANGKERERMEKEDELFRTERIKKLMERENTVN